MCGGDLREQTPREVRFTDDLCLGMRCRRAKGKCDELGLPPPKVEELDGGFFRVTFYRSVIEDGVALKVKDGGREDNREDNEDNREDNEDNSELVLASIARDPRLTVRQLAANLPISKATVERVLKSLQGNGRLRRVGGTRGYWEILK